MDVYMMNKRRAMCMFVCVLNFIYFEIHLLTFNLSSVDSMKSGSARMMQTVWWNMNIWCNWLIIIEFLIYIHSISTTIINLCYLSFLSFDCLITIMIQVDDVQFSIIEIMIQIQVMLMKIIEQKGLDKFIS